MAWWGPPFFRRLQSIGKGLISQLKFKHSVMTSIYHDTAEWNNWRFEDCYCGVAMAGMVEQRNASNIPKSLQSRLKRCSDWHYWSIRKMKLKLIDYHDRFTISADCRLGNRKSIFRAECGLTCLNLTRSILWFCWIGVWLTWNPSTYFRKRSSGFRRALSVGHSLELYF
jgi:hypothetical protein